MQIEQVLRQRDRRLTAGVRSAPPLNPWPDLIEDEPDEVVTAGTRRVCIVSRDVWGPVTNSRVGNHYRGLAFELAESGHEVTVLYTSSAQGENGELSDWVAYYKERNIQLVPLPDPEVPAGRSVVSQQGSTSYAVLEWLRAAEPFDVVHGPEIGGDLYHSLWAKRTALALENATFIVATHGGLWWDAEGNFRVLGDYGQMLRAQMELRCVELADVVVSPSQHMLGWLESHDVVLPDRTFVWPNTVHWTESDESQVPPEPVGGLAFLGSFEPRTGIHLFLNSLRLIPRKHLRGLPVWFLGEHSPRFDFEAALDELRSDRPEMTSTIRTELSSDEALSVLREERLLAVAPALLDDSPVVVSACISGRVPLVATDVGGVREMLHAACQDEVLCDPTPPDITNAILRALENGGTVPLAAHTDDINSVWCEWHSAQPEAVPVARVDRESRRPFPEVGDVTVCVVHHEQPDLLPTGLEALARQTLRPARIIVVDNGSNSDDSTALLRELSDAGEISGVELTVLRGRNRYPGAARNRAARKATTKYLVFADDDNVAKPHMIETLVRACESDPETACFTCFADYFNHGDEPTSSVTHRGVFLGGLGALGAMENAHGDTNSIVRRRHFEAVGGFHEVWGVGREDHDLFLRLSAGGYGVGVVPEALFYYRLMETRIKDRHLSREAGPSFATMSGSTALNRDVRLIVEGARGFHIRIRTLQRRLRSLKKNLDTEGQSHRAEMKVVRGNLRSLEKRLDAERQRFRATEERLAEAEGARSDLRWLLRRLDGTPARYVLRRFEGYKTLLRRYL